MITSVKPRYSRDLVFHHQHLQEAFTFWRSLLGVHVDLVLSFLPLLCK